MEDDEQQLLKLLKLMENRKQEVNNKIKTILRDIAAYDAVAHEMPMLVDGLGVKIEKAHVEVDRIDKDVSECMKMWDIASDIRKMLEDRSAQSRLSVLDQGFDAILKSIASS